jgi:hypothetical protein
MIMIFAEEMVHRGHGLDWRTQINWNAEFYDHYDFGGRGWYTDETD